MRPKNKRIETRVLEKLVQGNMSVLKGNKEKAINGMRKDSAPRETLAGSATMRRSVQKQHNRPLLLQNRRLNATGTFLWKGKLSEAAVFPERDLEDRAKATSVEIVRISHVIFGIFPNVNVTIQKRDANSVASAHSGTKRLTVRLTRSWS